MKAVVTVGNGGYETLDDRDVPVPAPRPGEVLLKVLAARVDNTEINTRSDGPPSSVAGGSAHLSGSSDKLDIADGGWNETTPFPLIQGTD